MFVRDLNECPEFLAGDSTHLREILHPDKEKLDLRYSLARAVVRPGETSLRHSLTVSEVYYILEGEGEMMVGAKTARVRAGHTIYIPPRSIQCIRNTGPSDLKFLCLCDPAWRPEHEVVHGGP